MSPITTHVLDVSVGRPAEGVRATLERQEGSGWQAIGSGVTNADGRIRDLLPAGSPLGAGTYRLSFDTRAYFEKQKVAGFYPSVPIIFEVRQPQEHYHVPLLLSPFGYSTYRGS